jgi:hypothetical protein
VRQLVDVSVFPDRTVTGIRPDPPSRRRIIDFTIANARAKKYCERGHADTEALFAANQGHEGKKKHYGRPGLLAPGDVLQPVAVEAHGGLHAEAEKQLREWAREAAGADDPGQGADILRVWQMVLSIGLLRARVGVVMDAAHRLDECDRRAVPVAEGQHGLPPRRRGIDGVCRVRSELERELGILPRRAGRVVGRGRR